MKSLYVLNFSNTEILVCFSNSVMTEYCCEKFKRSVEEWYILHVNDGNKQYYSNLEKGYYFDNDIYVLRDELLYCPWCQRKLAQ